MCLGRSLPLFAVCLSAAGHAKEINVVRRTVVGPDGDLEVLDEPKAMHVGFDVAANGQLGHFHGEEPLRGKVGVHTAVALNAEEDHEHGNTGVVEKRHADEDDEHVKDHAHGEHDVKDMTNVDKHMGNATVIRRNRKERDGPPCERPEIERARHKMCAHKECGPPPNAYMIGIVESKTRVESFSSEDDAMWDGYYPGDVTRTELDAHMTPDYMKCNCDGCQEWNDWAIKELAEPAQCKYPGHVWSLVFSRKNDGSNAINRLQTIPLHVGKVLTVKNEVMETFRLEDHLTKGAFTQSDLYKNVAKSQPVSMWKDAHTVHQDITLVEGESVSVWQYVLRCKLFNKAKMYINEVEFRTPNVVQNDKMAPPTCVPNQDGGFQECHKLSEKQNTNNKDTTRTEEVWKQQPFEGSESNSDSR